MRPGVRLKLFGILLALVVGVGLISGAYLEMRLESWMEGRIDHELIAQARLARDLIEAAPRVQTMEHVDGLADRMGRSSGARVTIIREDGVVLGDSQLDLVGVRSVGNHANRPEIVQAKSFGEGRARRYSATVKVDLLYHAVAYHRDDGAGVVRVAMPLSEVESAVDRLRVVLGVAGLMGLVLAILISGLASHLAARPLRSLVRSARAMRSGPGLTRLPLSSSDDELGRLVGSFNELVDELESTLARLANERDRLETILHGMSEAVLVMDAGDRVTDANPAALSLLGLAQAPIGRSLVEVVRVPTLAELMERIRSNAVDSRESELVLPRGRQVLARAAPLATTGGTIVVMLDITEMRRLEKVRRDFVANVSHELRTPVSVIQANAETLLEGALSHPDRGPQFLTAILRNAQRLARLVADLLDLSRIESGSFELEIKATSVATAVDRAVESIRGLASRKQLEVTSHVSQELRVMADANALDQILMNLLANAVSYTPERGHVDIRAELRGSVDGEAPSVVIDVCDDGVGIEPRHRARIFERFYRIDPGRSREMGGTGLGLAIVKHLINAMRGEVSVSSGPTGGSVFRVVLSAAA